MSSLTVVTAVNDLYVERMKIVLPTWRLKQEFNDCELIVFYNELRPVELDFVFEIWPQATLSPWTMPGASSVRECMLSAFVYGPTNLVQTTHYLKIDCDCYFSNGDRLFDAEHYDLDLIAHKWGYTKPAWWLAQLDAWANGKEIPGETLLSRSEREYCLDANRFGHARINSFACLHKTEFVQECVQYAGKLLPVPSHDTYLWYMAERLPHRTWGRINVKRRGAQHKKNEDALRQLTAEALEAAGA